METAMETAVEALLSELGGILKVKEVQKPDFFLWTFCFIPGWFR